MNFESNVAVPAGWPSSLGTITFDEGISGVLGSDVRCGGSWDAGVNAAADPPGILPRDDLPAVDFFVSRASQDDTFWAYPYLRIRSAHNSGEVKGLVLYDASGKSQGPFTPPLGSV